MISSSWTTAAAPGVWRVSKTEKTTHSSEWERKSFTERYYWWGDSILNLPPPPQGDVCNSRLVNHIFNTEPVDTIFHLAAKTHVGEWQWNPEHIWRLLVPQHNRHFLSLSQSRPSSPLLASTTSMWTEPKCYWELPTGPDISRGASSTLARMRSTGPAQIRSAGGGLFDRLVGLSHTATGWFCCAGLWWE